MTAERGARCFEGEVEWTHLSGKEESNIASLSCLFELTGFFFLLGREHSLMGEFIIEDCIVTLDIS